MFWETFDEECTCEGYGEEKVTSHDFTCRAFEKAIYAICDCNAKDNAGFLHDHCEVIKRMHKELCDCGEEYIAIDDIFDTHSEDSAIYQYLNKWCDYLNQPATTAVLSGTKEWGKDSIPYTYAATYFKSVPLSSCTWGNGFESLLNKSGTKTIYRTAVRKKYENTWLRYNNCGTTIINGVVTPIDVKIYLWSNVRHVVFEDYGASAGTWIEGCPSHDGCARDTGNQRIHMQFHFYKAGTNEEISVNGVMQLTDMDNTEGYYLDTGFQNVYTTSTTHIKKDSDGYYVGTQSEANDGTVRKDGAIMATFTCTPSAPAKLIYASRITFGMGFTNAQIAINYHLSGDIPSGVGTPSQILLAEGANTQEGINLIQSYASRAGYAFTGWNTDSITGARYAGSTCQNTSVNLYGQYTKLYGNLTISKRLGGPSQDFLNTIPNGNKTFTFNLSGTADCGDYINNNYTVVSGTDSTFYNIPVGTYTLTEVGAAGSPYWTCNNPSQTVNITNGMTSTVSFTNFIHTGNLTVSKQITGIYESLLTDSEKTFHFTLTGTSSYGAAVSYAGNIVGANSLTWENIPIGTYTLTETCDSNLWDGNNRTLSITISRNQTVTATIINTFTPTRVAQPAPTKSFDGRYSTNPSPKRLNGRNSVTFSVYQVVNQSKHSSVAPNKLSFSDTLESPFTYAGFKAYRSDNGGTTWSEDTGFTAVGNGQNVTFSKSGTFMGGDMYRIDITCTIKSDAHLESYVQNVDGTNLYVIPNKAQTIFSYAYGSPSTATYDSNTVKVILPIDETTVNVVKSNEVTGENISNAEFTVYEWDGTGYNTNKGKMSYVSRTQSYVMQYLRKTDQNAGKFKIVETKTPSGHIGSWSKEFQIGAAADLTLNATNPMGMGTITVYKKSKGDELLAGAKFSIKAKDNITSPQGKVLVAAGTEVDNVTTGSDGKAVSKKLYPGNYTVTETNAPLGYALNTTPQNVTVTYKDKDTEVTNSDVTFVNDRLYSTITVEKEIRYNDIVWKHGNPTFTFKLTGEDVLGNTHTYYETIEFTPDNTSASSSTVSKQVTFKVLAGTYTASEEKTARYEFFDFDMTENGVEDRASQTVKFDVSGKKDGTELTGPEGRTLFFNEKTTDEDLSATAFVRNKIA